MLFQILDGMSTTVDTFIYLQRDIEQSFDRLSRSSFRNQQEFDQLLRHLTCTIDDLQEVHRLLSSSVNGDSNVNKSRFDQNEREEMQIFPSNFGTSVAFSKPNGSNIQTTNSSATSIPSVEQREDFIHRMRQQLDVYRDKNEWKKQAPMEIIRLDPNFEDDDEDRRIVQQDKQLEDIHHSIVSLKNLTTNINTEIDGHIRVLDNLEVSMADNQDRVQNLTRLTKTFFLSSDGVGGHTYLFILAVGLFFLIIVLILFF